MKPVIEKYEDRKPEFGLLLFVYRSSQRRSSIEKDMLLKILLNCVSKPLF